MSRSFQVQAFDLDQMPVNEGTPTNDSKSHSLSCQTQCHLEAERSSYKFF